jgi:hypothetical protein
MANWWHFNTWRWFRKLDQIQKCLSKKKKKKKNKKKKKKNTTI